MPREGGLPELPSLFRPIALREGADALARAVALAPARGAGTLAWVGAYARAEAAVVLEPEMPLGPARLAFHVAATALADAVVALGPPELLVQLRWPGTLLVNRGACGRIALAAPPGAAETAVPEWLVVGMELCLAFPAGHEPGTDPGRTSLQEEGFERAVSGAELTAAWARHLLAGLDEWQARGPRRVAERFLARLVDEAEAPGTRRGLDPATGALVLERDGARRHLPLRPAPEDARWR
ncbi:biotin/lipoate--protein ligase family protein [Crenalkalicoccus roseus]|uniref:biotin/lipoate--protein ligase family protein n=1 Tax=Crenalkalicoccus roseus TaxID=1485588 RepID=UPI001F02AF68|nr:biotin/lipoate--protein ligase family protein [Crenalkalicoccus roseus]